MQSRQFGRETNEARMHYIQKRLTREAKCEVRAEKEREREKEERPTCHFQVRFEICLEMSNLNKFQTITFLFRFYKAVFSEIPLKRFFVLFLFFLHFSFPSLFPFGWAALSLSFYFVLQPFCSHRIVTDPVSSNKWGGRLMVMNLNWNLHRFSRNYPAPLRPPSSLTFCLP